MKDRLVFGMIGGFIGLPLGLLLLFLAFLVVPGEQPPPSIVWVTVVYCFVYGFLFGEELGDFIGMAGRFCATIASLELGQVIVEPKASWFKPTLAMLAFVLLLLILLRMLLSQN
ncbi:MAG: hypothetical protein HYZ17_05965 [Betaproteobacteria bacterium]|nr:hypothetical protein [Betaproteobacteria bacterium]